MSILVVLLSLAAGAYALAVIERWAVHGHLSLPGPAWAALALMGRESLLARKSDRLFFELGPVLLLVAGLMAVAVMLLFLMEKVAAVREHWPQAWLRGRKQHMQFLMVSLGSVGFWLISQDNQLYEALTLLKGLNILKPRAPSAPAVEQQTAAVEEVAAPGR